MLEALLSNGYYYSFLRNTASLFNDRVELANRLLEEYLSPYVSWERKNAQFYYWLRFDNVDTELLFDKLGEFILIEGRFFRKRPKTIFYSAQWH